MKQAICNLKAYQCKESKNICIQYSKQVTKLIGSKASKLCSQVNGWGNA